MSYSTRKMTGILASAAMVVSLCPATSALAYDQIASLQKPSGEQSLMKLLSADDVARVQSLIDKLPDAATITKAGRGAYDTQILAAVEAYSALTDEEQLSLDTMSSSSSSQPCGRVLESAQWALAALNEVDNSTTLADGSYDASTTPQLSSEYSKGKSTSSRQRPWSVRDVRITDGMAFATITVESSSYTYIYMSGKKFYNTAASGNSVFENVPVDLNSTQYLSAYSVPMSAEIAFSLTSMIDETDNDPADEVDSFEQITSLIGQLPRDPFAYTKDELAIYERKIADIKSAYNKLDDEQKSRFDSESYAGETSCARILEVAEWTLKSLRSVDNSTTLADGTYSLKSGDIASDLGLSGSSRQYNWHVQKIVVKDGRTTALMKRDGGNTPAGTVYFEGKTIACNADGTFEMPIAFNTDLYFSTKPANGTESTIGVSYHLNTALDISSLALDPKNEPDAETPSDEKKETGSKAVQESTSDQDANNAKTKKQRKTKRTGAAESSAEPLKRSISASGSLLASGNEEASDDLEEPQSEDSQNSAEQTGPSPEDDAAAIAISEKESSDTDETDADMKLSPFAVGGGFAGCATLGGLGFFGMFRRRERH